jgi:hypothetical protein
MNENVSALPLSSSEPRFSIGAWISTFSERCYAAPLRWRRCNPPGGPYASNLCSPSRERTQGRAHLPPGRGFAIKIASDIVS